MNVELRAPRRLESYVGGQWVRGSRDGTPLLNAATGAAGGADQLHRPRLRRRARLRPRRRRPGAAQLTFHERAAMLKALGQALMAMKEEFYAESLATGATRADGWVDIEGGIGTLLSYASKARRELPEHPCADRRRRRGPLQGRDLLRPAHPDPARRRRHPHQRLQLSLLGDAGEDRADADRRHADDGEAGEPDRLPDRADGPPDHRHRPSAAEGALQLVSGSVGDLLDHVTGQDAVTFTGSAWTGRKLKVAPGDRREFGALHHGGRQPERVDPRPRRRPRHAGVRPLRASEVAREMTVKAGQKCTAIRRVIAPRAHVDALVAALGDRLAKTALGDPADEAVRMGPLASLDQRREVRDRIRELSRKPRSSRATPTSARGLRRRREGRLPEPRRALLRRPLTAAAIHDVEAFGPVSTVMPYDSLDEAVALAKRGKGSLVASVFTNDKAVAEEAVIGLAPFHGRVLIGNRDSAKTSTGHGSPLPVLVHGGPGRAGGGEEMGGIRGVKHYMQRTAVQGTPRLLDRGHRALDRGRRRAGRRRASVPQVAGRAPDRRPAGHRDAHGDPRGHRAFRQRSPATPSTPTWTRRRRRRTRSSTAGSRTAT